MNRKKNKVPKTSVHSRSTRLGGRDNDSSGVVAKESVVLTFVGILATFVVVGNYFQVKDIERSFDEKVKGIERSFGEKLQGVEESIRRDAQRYVAANSSKSLLQISSGVSKIPLSRTDAIIDLLSYAIQDYNDLKERRSSFILKIVENTQYLYDNNLFILSDRGTVDYFLNEFIKLQDQDSQIESLAKKIRLRDDEQRKSQ
jgi:hypothetical protein